MFLNPQDITVEANGNSRLLTTPDTSSTSTKLTADLPYAPSASNENVQREVMHASKYEFDNQGFEVKIIYIDPELLEKSEALRSWGYKIGQPLKKWGDIYFRYCECFERPNGMWMVEHESRVVVNDCAYDCPDSW